MGQLDSQRGTEQDHTLPDTPPICPPPGGHSSEGHHSREEEMPSPDPFLHGHRALVTNGRLHQQQLPRRAGDPTVPTVVPTIQGDIPAGAPLLHLRAW